MRQSIIRLLLWPAIVIAAVAASAVAWLGYCEYNNSRAVPMPSQTELREHFARAAGWMFANEPRISTENNPMLWVFITDAGKLTGNTRILTMASTYREHYVNGTINQFFFDPGGSEKVAGRRLTFPDFWAEDAYLQKVMTLLESGRRKDIKPIWVRRILEAQRADGGWDGVDIVARLPGSRVLAWEGGRLYPWPRRLPQTNLHATAQGLYILALLLNQD